MSKVCVACKSRVTKLWHLSDGVQECQICGHREPFENLSLPWKKRREKFLEWMR